MRFNKIIKENKGCLTHFSNKKKVREGKGYLIYN
jgi:hypothetical protein